MKKPEEERTFAYQVNTGSGPMMRSFIVEFTRPLEGGHWAGGDQAAYLSQLRDAIRLYGATSDRSFPEIKSVREINPITGQPGNSNVGRLHDALHSVDIFIAPAPRQ